MLHDREIWVRLLAGYEFMRPKPPVKATHPLVLRYREPSPLW